MLDDTSRSFLHLQLVISADCVHTYAGKHMAKKHKLALGSLTHSASVNSMSVSWLTAVAICNGVLVPSSYDVQLLAFLEKCCLYGYTLQFSMHCL